MQELFRVKQTAQYMGIGVSTVWYYSSLGLIKPIKLSDRVTCWAKSELDAFIATRMGV